MNSPKNIYLEKNLVRLPIKSHQWETDNDIKSSHVTSHHAHVAHGISDPIIGSTHTH